MKGKVPGRASVVIDTNVAVVANARDTDASPECIEHCVEFLVGVTKGRLLVVLDTDREILEEYLRNVSESGQPGVGDAFLKWLLRNQANPRVCNLVEIRALPDPPHYEGFPDDPALASFDPSDRKFVMVALESPSNPSVANAVDSDWWNHRQALERAGVRIELLCPDVVELWQRGG